jgi:hypothetical protein
MRANLPGILGASIMATLVAQQTLRTISIDQLDGGTMNPGSSLHRTWYTVNDSTCPVQIVGARLAIQSSPWATYFTYQPSIASLVTNRAVHALEFRYVLIDLFGRPIATISELRIQDVPKSGNCPLPPNPLDAGVAPAKRGKQPLVEERPLGILEAPLTETQRLHSMIAFVARIRMADGQTWNHDPNSLLSQIRSSLKLEVAAEALQSNRERK